MTTTIDLAADLKPLMVRALSDQVLPEGVEHPRILFWVEDDKGRRWVIVCHYVPPPYLEETP